MGSAGFLARREFALGLAGGAAALTFPAAAQAAPRRRLSRKAYDPLLRLGRDLGVRGLVVADSRETLLSDGDVTTPLRIASIRKSILSALYGIAVAEKGINLDATLESIGVDDYQKLVPAERRATVRNLIQARSGIYLPTSAESPAMKAARPARGSHAPGSFWYYNNWDFNALGEIYQRLTGEDLFVSIEHRLARPLGWQDFDPLKHMRWSYDAENPRFPAYAMWMSARDLARFGQLFLRRGDWQGRQIVPAAWVTESTAFYSATGRAGWGSGYGYMWWLASNQGGAEAGGLPPGAFTAAGNGGRYITVFPSLDLVIAVQPDEKQGQPPVPLYAQPDGYLRLLRALVAAHS